MMFVGTVRNSISKFYIRTLFKKLPVEQFMHISKVEDVVELYVKKTSDVTFIKLLLV